MSDLPSIVSLHVASERPAAESLEGLANEHKEAIMRAFVALGRAMDSAKADGFFIGYNALAPDATGRFALQGLSLMKVF